MKTLPLAFYKTKASSRPKDEHPFHVTKNLFGARKVRYKGLAKIPLKLYPLFDIDCLPYQGDARNTLTERSVS
ncbi:hypothetical protein KG088_17255 [Halomonas sp. TRM85114]|nr:hypothetical protein [Halomonas jincaotanensis]